MCTVFRNHWSVPNENKLPAISSKDLKYLRNIHIMRRIFLVVSIDYFFGDIQSFLQTRVYFASSNVMPLSRYLGVSPESCILSISLPDLDPRMPSTFLYSSG